MSTNQKTPDSLLFPSKDLGDSTLPVLKSSWQLETINNRPTTLQIPTARTPNSALYIAAAGVLVCVLFLHKR